MKFVYSFVTIFIFLNLIFVTNPITNGKYVKTPDVEIEIKGNFGIVVVIDDMRENISGAISTQIWINYSYFIRPIFNRDNQSFLHKYFSDIDYNRSASMIYWVRNPYIFGIGTCSISVRVGNTIKNDKCFIFSFFNRF